MASIAATGRKMGSDEGKGDGGMPGPHGGGQYSREEIEKGLSKFAEKGYHVFRSMVEDFRQEIEDAGVMSEKGVGHGRGVSRDADILCYVKRAESLLTPG
jgi:stalled ribosome alternative rescue factor ArfA